MNITPSSELLKYYTIPGPFTDPGQYAHFFDDLPTDIGELCRVVQNNLLHVFWADRYGRRLSEDERSCEERYHIASIIGAKRGLSAIRSHWGIENQLHWCPDMAFDEDRCRVRKEQGAENFAILRYIALNLLKQEKTCQRSINGKRLLAGWDEDYLFKVLFGFSTLNL